jgi:hypothetical protein
MCHNCVITLAYNKPETITVLFNLLRGTLLRLSCKTIRELFKTVNAAISRRRGMNEGFILDLAVG